tara:strand:+ start:202 stop:417 length:216 start_codon:yes stop_codon:yes gene_type:complete
MKSYKKSVRRNQKAGSRRLSKNVKRSKSMRKSRKSIRTKSRKSKGIIAQIGGFLRDLSVAPSGGFRVNPSN